MRQGKIDKDSIPVSRITQLTVPMAIEARGELLTLIVNGKRIEMFQGVLQSVERAQAEYEKAAF